MSDEGFLPHPMGAMSMFCYYAKKQVMIGLGLGLTGIVIISEKRIPLNIQIVWKE